MRAAAKQRLDKMLATLPKPTHQTPQDYQKPIEAFIDIYDSGDTESLHPDTVREWATEAGFGERDARDLGEMADTVLRTLRITERPQSSL